MPRDGDNDVKVEIRMPASLKARAERMARAQGDGDLSSWYRRMTHQEWQRHEGDYDHLVTTSIGTFAFRDVAPRVSPLPRWEVIEVFEKHGPQIVGVVDVHVDGQFTLPREGRPVLAVAFRALIKRYGEEVVSLRPTVSRG